MGILSSSNGMGPEAMERAVIALANGVLEAAKAATLREDVTAIVATTEDMMLSFIVRLLGLGLRRHLQNVEDVCLGLLRVVDYV